MLSIIRFWGDLNECTECGCIIDSETFKCRNCCYVDYERIVTENDIAQDIIETEKSLLGL